MQASDGERCSGCVSSALAGMTSNCRTTLRKSSARRGEVEARITGGSFMESRWKGWGRVKNGVESLQPLVELLNGQHGLRIFSFDEGVEFDPGLAPAVLGQRRQVDRNRQPKDAHGHGVNAF